MKPNVTDRHYKQNALFAAVNKKDFWFCKWLLEEGWEDLNSGKRFDINEPRACDGYTPLHCAIEKNNPPIVGLLLSYGAELTPSPKIGISPLELYKKLPGRDARIGKILDAHIQARNYIENCAELHEVHSPNSKVTRAIITQDEHDICRSELQEIRNNGFKRSVACLDLGAIYNPEELQVCCIGEGDDLTPIG
ncbi:MAG: hypothetical protein Tsb006_7530 [Rickettsiaceae bacterium]